MDQASNLVGEAPINLPSPLSGTHWSSTEEGMLQALVQRSPHRKKSAEEWDRIAAEYSHTARALGFPGRTGSGCRNKAASMGLHGARTAPVKQPPRVERVEVNGQATFAATEVRNVLADLLEEFAKKLRGVA